MTVFMQGVFAGGVGFLFASLGTAQPTEQKHNVAAVGQTDYGS